MPKLLETLKLVCGAVSDKDLVPVLTHFAFRAGRVYGYDGRLSIDAPCEATSHLSCTVDALRFVAAIENCQDAPPAITMEGDKLHVRVKKYRATLPTGDLTLFPEPPIVAGKMRGAPQFLDTLRLLRPFIGQDASRPWAAGINFAGTIAAATNNVVIAVAERWMARPPSPRERCRSA